MDELSPSRRLKIANPIRPSFVDQGASRQTPFLERMGSSVVVGPAAQFLGGGALRLFCEPTDFGAERRSAGATCFGNDHGARDQFVQSRPGFGSICLLGTVLAGRYDQHAVLRHAIARQHAEAPSYFIGKRRRLTNIKAKLDGCGNFVDILPARTGGTNKGYCKFGIWNVDRQSLSPD